MTTPTLDNKNTVTFPTDYKSIFERIARVDPVAYGKSRNFINGAVTYLSPYISRGVISVKQIQDAIIHSGYSSATIEKFLQELAWREYFQRVWQVKKDALFEDLKGSQNDVRHRQMIQAIAEAITGIIYVDEKIRDLYASGYMHNHIRMYVASLACNIGKSHWRVPSQWMYYHLLDGDLASNTCSWQWVAGTFSNKKYYCSQENINRYTHSIQTKTYLDVDTSALPDVPIPGVLLQTIEPKLSTELPAVDKPTIDVNKPTLIYNSYNLDPRWRENEDCNRVLLLEPSHFERFPVSRKVIDFILSLSSNIKSCQVMVGEVWELAAFYGSLNSKDERLISKEHPAFDYYPGIKDPRDWIYPEVNGSFNSFFSFWKKCKKFQ